VNSLTFVDVPGELSCSLKTALGNRGAEQARPVRGDDDGKALTTLRRERAAARWARMAMMDDLAGLVEMRRVLLLLLLSDGV
jgi:hypothetical protein